MLSEEPIDKIFEDDVYEKRLAGRIANVSRGARAKRYPHEMMTGKEKRDYTKSGKVQVTNMYENILPYEEFKKIEPAEKRAEVLQSWRDKFNNAQIERTWGMKTHQYYKVVKEHGLKTATPGNAKAKQQSIGAGSNANQRTNKNNAVVLNSEGLGISYAGVFKIADLETKFTKIVGFLKDEGGAFSVSISVFEDIAPEQANEGIKINYNGTFSGEELLARFDKISGFLKDETGKFNVRILVQEEAA